MERRKSNNYGTASLVLGIASIVFCWTIVIGLIAGVLGLIFSLKQKRIYPNGINTAGLVTSIIGLALSVIYIIMWLAFFNVMGSSMMTFY